jgi:hypothetical protein
MHTSLLCIREILGSNPDDTILNLICITMLLLFDLCCRKRDVKIISYWAKLAQRQHSWTAKCEVVHVFNLLSSTLWCHVGEWRYSSTILEFGTKWRWMVTLALWPLYSRGHTKWHPWDRPLYSREHTQWHPWGRRLRLPHSRYDSCVIEKLLSCRELNLRRPICSSSLDRLSYAAPRLCVQEEVGFAFELGTSTISGFAMLFSLSRL